MPLNILEDASAGDSDLDKLAPNELDDMAMAKLVTERREEPLIDVDLNHLAQRVRAMDHRIK